MSWQAFQKIEMTGLSLSTGVREKKKESKWEEKVEAVSSHALFSQIKQKGEDCITSLAYCLFMQ